MPTKARPRFLKGMVEYDFTVTVHWIDFLDRSPELDYRGGQSPIVHLEANLQEAVAWAKKHSRCWAFTLSNAGAYYFEDRCDLDQLHEIDWNAVEAKDWRKCKEGKQAEFLVEHQFPWELVSRIGVLSRQTYDQTVGTLQGTTHKPRVDKMSDWYY